MGGIVAVMSILALVFSFVFGKTENLSMAAVSACGEAFSLVLSLVGGLCFWSGIMRLMDKCKITDFVKRLISPLIALIFPKLKRNSEAAKLISLNISANLLGLGNAATPFGIAAMRELQKLNRNSPVASDYMIYFAVINSSSIQLLPTTLATLRASFGSDNPLDILPAVICTSILSLTFGLFLAKILSLYKGRKNK